MQNGRDLATGTEGERTERMKQLMAIEAEAGKVAPLYESPVQVLSRTDLGSAERAATPSGSATPNRASLSTCATGRCTITIKYWSPPC